jgi:hypothetical protein
MGLLSQTTKSNGTGRTVFFSANKIPYTMATTPTPAQVLEALLDGNEDLFLLDNLISTGNAIIRFIWLTDLDDDVKNAFFELEKRFRLYATLMDSFELRVKS